MTETTVRKRARREGKQECRADEDEVAACSAPGQAGRAAGEANKPFLCLVDGCDKRYTTNENLLEHRKRKHDVTEKAETDMFFLLNLEHFHHLYVLQVCVDGHIEVIEVGAFPAHQLLIELRIFFAFLNNVCLAVGFVLHHLLRKIHRFDCFDYYIIVSLSETELIIWV
jgi:hypothetical protein